MAHTLTEKENLMLVISGQQPEWVPVMSAGRDPKKSAPMMNVWPELLSATSTKPGIVKDVFGVTYVPVEDAANAKLPEPNNFILKDIRQWRDVIKAPDISGIDWEAMAKRDMAFYKINRDETALSLAMHFGYFQYLMAFMGFNEGLCAIFEEPEEVRALSEYLCDFFVKVIESCIDYYQPDIFDVRDDIASWQSPFLSPEAYREIFKPVMTRQTKIAVDRGLPISMHCCGHCEEFIDDWRDFGVTMWNPAQTSNDLTAIKQKYGNSLIISGGWDGRGDLLRPDVTEEEVKASVYQTMDKLAPGGGYVFGGGFLGKVGSEESARKNKWLAEAAETYGRSFYNK